MASPTISTPSSAGSPAALAPHPPSLAIKTNNMPNMAAITPSSAAGAPPIVTRKEWVIPPRPKPGRKPATDTPPTKRKAQNRAAQRAFRERRAARVGELEEQLEETKDEHQRREAELRDKIQRLESEVQRFNGELQSWKLRCDTLDRLVEYERNEKDAALVELSYLRKGIESTGTDAVPLPPRRNRQAQKSEVQQFASFTPDIEDAPTGCGDCSGSGDGRCACVDAVLEIAANGCGKCTLDTPCVCLEETIEAASDMPSFLDHKRSHSPVAEYAEKRQRHSDPTPLEVDFTAQFSSSKSAVHIPTQEQMTTRRPGESCGFCDEGTYCACAEAAAALAREQENRLAPLLNEVTPPPSDTDVESAVKLPSMHPNQMHRPVATTAPANSCANGPGTCQQCQNDPKSGLFCRSLAAMRAVGTASADDCCGGNATGGGCCKSQPAGTSTQPPPSLSCADTYKTLSTHKGFDQATDELNSWLGRLHASPPQQVVGRAPLEVEAASVMGVLKLFDRRFGRG
ncbi:hypothetical protein B0O99DRAFT_654363 [Bisporella sp. PMI_857]|nr:hypothetical protein B0O99DRAFT_654363 [Bisporella sp. PMI_857]